MERPARTTRSAATARFVVPQSESRVVLWVTRVLIALACVYIGLSCWSTYRRIWQIQRIELLVSSPVLTPGVTVSSDVITSGETRNRILLELEQEAHSETLMEQRAKQNQGSHRSSCASSATAGALPRAFGVDRLQLNRSVMQYHHSRPTWGAI